jgi:internalin A
VVGVSRRGVRCQLQRLSTSTAHNGDGKCTERLTTDNGRRLVLLSDIVHDIEEAGIREQTPAPPSSQEACRTLPAFFSSDHTPRTLENNGLPRFGVASRAGRFQGRVETRFEKTLSRRIETPMKRRIPNQPAAALAFVLILAPWVQSASADSPPFPDKNLEAAIRDVLKHEPKVQLTDEKLLDIYFLEAPGKEIKDLTGLEKCKNLALIKLDKNKISDLKPLKDLANLQSLDLAENTIKDITPLAGLKSLQYIKLSGNKIEAIDALKDLTSLNSIYLGNNQIKDISPLAALNKVWTLSANKNQIKDISVLSKITKLQTIDLENNKIEDTTPLGKQSELKLLMLKGNQIKDLKPLVDAAKADSAGPKKFAPYLHVYIADNPLPDKTKSDQIKALKDAEVRIDE